MISPRFTSGAVELALLGLWDADVKPPVNLLRVAVAECRRKSVAAKALRATSSTPLVSRSRRWTSFGLSCPGCRKAFDHIVEFSLNPVPP